MPERYRRAEDALADLIRENRRGTRDAQRATGTEKAQTALVAEAALEAADAASETADGKSTVVRSTSPATGAGSYKQGDQWWQFSGANIVGLWLHSGAGWVAQELTNAIIATLDAGKITTGTLAADRIGANSITTAKLAATAIDGMTITGALIRTAATGQRMEFDMDGFKSFTASGVLTSLLSAYDGYFSLSSPSDSKRMVLSPSTLWAYDDATICAALGKFGLQVYPVAGITAQYMHDRAFVERSVTHSTTGAATHTVQMVANTDSSVTVSAGIVTASNSVRDATASLSANFDSGGIPRSTLSADKALVNEIASFTNASDPSPSPAPLSIKSANGLLLDTDTGSGTIKLNSGGTGIEINRASGGSLVTVAGTGSNKASVELTGASAGKIRLNAAAIEYSNDTGWVTLTLASGWTALTSDGYEPLAIRRQGTLVEVRGAASKASWANWNVLATIPAALRPIASLDGPFRHTVASVGAAQIRADGEIRVSAGATFVVLSAMWTLG